MEIRFWTAPGGVGVSSDMVYLRMALPTGEARRVGLSRTVISYPRNRHSLVMTQASTRYDVVVAGAGTVGLALACALADALGSDARIALVDRAEFGREPATRDMRA